LADEAYQDPESIFNAHQIDESVNNLQESSWITKLVIDLFPLEVFAPHQQYSQQLSHLLLVMLQFVHSVDIAGF
jgi:hypothetical protein